MTDSNSTSEIENILTTLFHSYDARGNQLAIDEAKAKLNQILVRERLDELNKIYGGTTYREIVDRRKQLQSQLREGETE